MGINRRETRLRLVYADTEGQLLGRNPAARRKFPPLHPTTHTYLTTALTLACRSQGDVVTLLAYTGM
jgi:hypothetical protein